MSTLSDACAAVVKAEQDFNDCDAGESAAQKALEVAMVARKDASKKRNDALAKLETAKARLMEAV